MLDIIISPSDLLRCGQQLKTTPTKLSPLSGHPQTAPEVALPQKYPQLFNSQGKLAPEWGQVFRTLNQATQAGRIYLQQNKNAIEIGIYYAPSKIGQHGVSLIKTGAGIRLQSPPAINYITDEISERTGETMLPRFDLDLSLSPLAAYTALATLDAGRQYLLQTILSEGIAAIDGLSLEHVYQAALTPKSGPQWFSPFLKKHPDLGQLTREKLNTGLQELRSQNLLQINQRQIVFAPTIDQLLQEFLILEGQLDLQVARLDQARNLIVMEFKAIQGRLGAILFGFEQDDQLHFSGLSPAQLLIKINNLLESPKKILAEYKPTTSPLADSVSPDAQSETTLAIGQGVFAVDEGYHQGQRFILGQNTRLGRAHDNDIQLKSPLVSRYHLLINRTKTGYVITELGSANGTQVNNQAVRGRYALKHGDIIVIGSERMIFREE